MRAKFKCNSVMDQGFCKTADLNTEYSDTKEDNEFAEATPCGTISIQVDNPDAMDFLVPGESYYVDFTKVPKEA